MARQEQVERLLDSIDEWNQWRLQQVTLLGADLSEADMGDLDLDKTTDVFPDLRGADLTRADLRKALLCGVNLIQAILRDADLTEADLTGAFLIGTDLTEAKLNFADLAGADLSLASLSRADLAVTNLREADLTDAYLNGAILLVTDLTEANLTKVNLRAANLNRAKLNGTTLTEARFGSTTFSGVDLRSVKGLETAIHEGPSAIDLNSVILPVDEYIRDHFLQGIGFTQTQIEHLPSLLTPRPTQYRSVFISYAHQDKAIAERLYTDLRKNDVSCWFAPHELKPGDYYREKIDEAIRSYDKLVLILSEHSVKSKWVEKEVKGALEKEDAMDMTQHVLFPLRLDDTVMKSNRNWVSSLRYLRHIGDFTQWKDHDAYQTAFQRLLSDIKTKTIEKSE